MKKLLTLTILLISLFANAQTPDFFDFGVREIKIYFAEKDWEKKLAETRAKNPNGRMTCSVSIDGQRFDECGIRYKGNSSYKRTKRQGFRKLPFNIKLDHARKGQTLPGGYTTLKLANVTGDPSFIREPLSYEIARDYMPAPRANFIRVYVNDVFFGIYTNVESIDASFLKRQFGTTGGSLIKCDPELDEKPLVPPSCDALLKNDRRASLNVFTEDTLCYPAIYELEKGSFGAFHRMIKTLTAQPEKVDQVVNADQALWMHAFNNVLVNLDSYSGLLCHNYYMWQDTAGRWQPLVWDMNLSFGGFKRLEVETQLGPTEMQKLPPMLHADNGKRPLVSVLLRQPLYRKIYVAHVRTILNEWFLNGKYLSRAKEMQQAIEPWVNSDTIKLFDSKGFRENLTSTVIAQRSAKEKEEVIGIEELMKARAEFLFNHPEIKKAGPKVETPIAKNTDGTFEIEAKITGAKKVWLFHSPTDGGSFQKILLRDDGNDGDSLANDGQYFARLQKAKIRRYYLVAENDEAATCLPEKASHSPFRMQ